jgi:hypothetical protein
LAEGAQHPTQAGLSAQRSADPIAEDSLADRNVGGARNHYQAQLLVET